MIITRDRTNPDKQVVTAVVRHKNIGQGSTASSAVIKAMDKIKAKGDENGHIVAKVLGGPGDNVDNFIPMNASLNKGKFMGFERKIKNAILKNEDWEAHLKIVLIYGPKYEQYPERPRWIHYHCEFFEGGTSKEKFEDEFENKLP